MYELSFEEKLRNYCVEMTSNHDAAHDMWHTDLVVANVKRLLFDTPCNHQVVVAAAYLHDLKPRGSCGDYSMAPIESAELAHNVLEMIGFSTQTIADIHACIVSASWEHAATGGEPTSLESYVLRDADLLEAIGAHGIARVFLFSGYAGLPLRWLDVDITRPPRLPSNIQGPDPSPFHHFYSKLLWLGDLFFTEAAKLEATQRRQFLIQFLKSFERENSWNIDRQHLDLMNSEQMAGVHFLKSIRPQAIGDA
jgi:uncharacterized protein